MRSNFDYLTIKNYLEGKLDHQAMHDIEKRALDDPFLADALEGYTFKAPDEKQLSILQRQLEDHIALKQEKNNTLHFGWQRLSIAAAAGLMFIIACILFWLHNFPLNTRPEAGKAPQTNSAPLHTGSTPENSVRISKNATAYVDPATGLQPEGGWVTYGNYIDSQLSAFKNSDAPAISGEVLLEFEINSGQQAENIKIVRGLSSGQDSEAVRIVKDGPLWVIPASGKTKTIRLSVIF